MTLRVVSKQTIKNWWVNALLFCSAILASATGIYFLFLPSGGFQGGRNPYYNLNILFDRHTWDSIHTWTGATMIAIAVIHILIHWKWVKSMVKRTWNEITGKCGCMNAAGRWNLILNTLVGISFILTAISGVYFMFVQNPRWVVDPMIIFTRYTWDMLHTWSGVVMIAAATIHLIIHWRWVVNVTRKIFKTQVAPDYGVTRGPQLSEQ